MHESVAIVTGGTRGIGRAVALQLAQQGHSIVINYLRSRDAAHQVVRTIEQDGGRAVAIQADVGAAESSTQLLEAAAQLGGHIHALINNAGITSLGRRDLLDLPQESWDRVMATNLKGPFFLAQAVAQQQIQEINARGGEAAYIVNISSISAYAASRNRADYCIAKAGMQMMTWLFAERMAEHHVLVYEVCPGIIESDMTAPVKEKYDKLILQEGITPIRRWGRPEDVASAVTMLTSGCLSFSTGERINVDGGFHIRRL